MSHPVGIEANLHAILDVLTENEVTEHPVGIEANLHAILDRTGEINHKTDELEQNKADMIVPSASGSIASFPDGADNQPVKKLTVGIEPVQDLHGYDNPWPAGGGKNLLNAPDITLAEAGTVYSGAISLAAGTYTLSSSNTTVSVTVGEESGVMPLTFTLAEVISTIEITASAAGTFKNLQIESGSSATTYAPYSNICPISGWTGVNVTRTGKNLLNPEGNDQSGKVNNGITFTVNSDGTITCNGTATAQARYYFENNLTFDSNVIYTCEGAVSGVIACYAGGQNIFEDNPRTYTAGISMGANFLYVAEGKTLSNYIVKPMIRLADATDGTFEPYQSQSIPITFPTEAGTVYGGTLTINQDGTGKLVVDMASVDLGTLSWGYSSTENRFYAMVSGIKNYDYSAFANIFCEKYRTHSWSGSTNGDIFSAREYVSVKDFAYTDVAIFKSAMSGVMLVYELATPIIYTLTAPQVRTLLGTNNIWADTGDSSVEYPADTKLYIEQLTKPEENDMIANSNISSGKFFMVGNTLYLSTSQIAAGAKINPGTNCTQVSLADALNALNT